MEGAHRLFAALSDASSVRRSTLLIGFTQLTHPFCAHCAQDTIHILEKRLSSVKEEYEAFKKFLSENSVKHFTGTSNILSHQKHIPPLSTDSFLDARQDIDEEYTPAGDESYTSASEEKGEITRNLAILEEISAESQATLQEIEKAKESLELLSKKEEDYWNSLNSRQMIQAEGQEQEAILETRSLHAFARTKQLDAMTVWESVFGIQYDGHFATINGMPIHILSHFLAIHNIIRQG